jgi:hypothetical protein
MTQETGEAVTMSLTHARPRLGRLSFTVRLGLMIVLTCAGLGCEGVVGDANKIEAPRLPPDDPSDPRLEVRAWRLSPAQYNTEIERMFGPGAPAADLPEGASEYGLTNIAETARVDLGNAGRFADSARAIGTWVASNGETVARCEGYGTPACVDTFLGWYPASAFRRPTTDAERAELRTLFDDLARDYDYDYAFSGLVRAVLLSPRFIYRWELGTGASGLVELDDYEIASLLSFSITDRAPDEALLADAAAGQLRDPAARERHARRLMVESTGVWQRFFWEWLELATLESQGNEVGLSPMLVQQIDEEYRRFVAEIVVEDRGTLRDLLTASHTWTRPELAAHYGASHPGGDVARIELDPEERGGLLTLGAWLVAHGKRGRDNVVRRGMGTFRDAMCNAVLPLDIDLEAALDELVGEDATVREIVEARGNDATCGACHRIADPVGLVFESYASDASWQTTYATDGLPVETQIELDGVGSFDRAPEFSAALADDVTFQHCLVQRFAHYLMGVEVGSPDAVRWTGEAHADFVASDGSFEELLVSVVRDPAFIERRKQP